MTALDEGTDALPGPLPARVRGRVVAIASESLGGLSAEQLPAALSRVASFAPARRAKLAGDLIATVVEDDAAFRAHVGEEARSAAPELAERVERGGYPAAADPVEVATLAYLLRPRGWVSIVQEATTALSTEQHALDRSGSRQVEQLRRQVEAATKNLTEARHRHRERLAALKHENSDLRHKLGDARSRLRSAEAALETAAGRAEELTASADETATRHEGELRRLRSRVEDLERELAAGRRADRTERGNEALRARLLLDTLLDTAQGLRRELALPAVEGSPADAVEAHLAEEGNRSGSGQGSLGADDPGLLGQLLTLPRVHVVVDGYNVTKAAWADLSLERQRERLLSGLAPLAARFGAELTVVFDAAGTRERPVVQHPRGVRVLYSPVGVIADDVIRDLVAAEPRGRPVVVVTSDGDVVRDVVRAGARAVSAASLVGLLGRG